MMNETFTPSAVEKNFFTDSVPAANRGKSFSIKDMYGTRISKNFVQDSNV